MSQDAKKAAPKFRKGVVKVNGRELRFDSRWEANYAHYLAYRQAQGEIRAWVRNTTRFPFRHALTYPTSPGKIGVCASYVPDFLVIDADGRASFHEVKGWRHSRGEVQFTAFLREWPELPLVVIDKPKMISIQARIARREIPAWVEIR